MRAYQQGNHANLDAHVRRKTLAAVALSSPVVAESLRGRVAYALSAEPPQFLIAHDYLRQAIEQLNGFTWIYPDAKAAAAFAEMKKKFPKHNRLPDMMIAAIAIAGDHIVVTRNRKDFADLLPPLQLQNWIDDPPVN